MTSDTPLTPYGIEQLKLEHNSLVLSGRTLLAEIENLAKRVNTLREQIKAADPDEYDEIRLLFEGTFQVDEDERVYRELTQEEKDHVDGDH